MPTDLTSTGQLAMVMARRDTGTLAVSAVLSEDIQGLTSVKSVV
jgi:hypothetical protein